MGTRSYQFLAFVTLIIMLWSSISVSQAQGETFEYELTSYDNEFNLKGKTNVRSSDLEYLLESGGDTFLVGTQDNLFTEFKVGPTSITKLNQIDMTNDYLPEPFHYQDEVFYSKSPLLSAYGNDTYTLELFTMVYKATHSSYIYFLDLYNSDSLFKGYNASLDYGLYRYLNVTTGEMSRLNILSYITSVNSQNILVAITYTNSSQEYQQESMYVKIDLNHGNIPTEQPLKPGNRVIQYNATQVLFDTTQRPYFMKTSPDGYYFVFAEQQINRSNTDFVLKSYDFISNEIQEVVKFEGGSLGYEYDITIDNDGIFLYSNTWYEKRQLISITSYDYYGNVTGQTDSVPITAFVKLENALIVLRLSLTAGDKVPIFLSPWIFAIVTLSFVYNSKSKKFNRDK